eukprot:4848407-Amphidinium_carterae.1
MSQVTRASPRGTLRQLCCVRCSNTNKERRQFKGEALVIDTRPHSRGKRSESFLQRSCKVCTHGSLS